MSSYLVKRNVTLTNDENEGTTYLAGDVVSDFELPDHVKENIKKGVSWHTTNFESLTDREAEAYRKKATALEGKRQGLEGSLIDPPWDDYVGLHPKEVIDRMSKLSFGDTEKVRQYERAKLNRPLIIDYVSPSEREPWYEYDQCGTREILEKMDLLDPQAVQDVITYEMNHKKRPAILTFEPEEDGFPDAPHSEDSEKVTAGVGAAEESKE
jgi:hypothetical protein